ncbi:PLD nuclease N-terminal domain-containing protein [Nocardioides sp. GXQ0305]|uniref:PLD nuclease N-terminal domain-containing protein n=1 Tax=Nocardioides sp. GXQ0305 TaxID=3423912 RepID=UPI003D7D3630
MATRQWSDLSSGQKRAVYVAGAVETVLTLAALVDLARRPAVDVRGPKAAWAVAAFVQPVGPVAYFLAGRR